VKKIISKFLHVLYPILVLLVALIAWMIKGEGVSFGLFFHPSANPIMIPEVQYCYGSCLGTPDAPAPPAIIPNAISEEASKHTSVRHSISFSATI
jgi:hypothetical protein